MVATMTKSEVSSATTGDALEQYVSDHGGRRVIRKILIANNGMAATKAILSMREWAYKNLGDEQALEFVAMATPEDLNANAEFVRLANSYVEVPGGVNRNNYANVDLIVKTAKEQGVQGVWPGWGHASENPDLPDNLKKAGIQFIGPTGSVMSVLGDKIAANILAQTAKVPSIPWSGDGLEAKLTDDGRIPEETFKKGTVTNVEEAVAAADRIGYPVMLKASEGGGGKGIRMSDTEEELRANFDQVKNEVPGSPMFMMQLCTQARHLEVQVVGDEHGNAVALNGRDCSTQRRFQKIFEEGSPTIAPKATFREMEKAAQRLVQSIGYIGAGTVEYLYNVATGNYYFLELNPRLQVEHPVTEGITNVNLPATQLQVAMGIPLDRIPDVRRLYAKDPEGKGGDIDFLEDEYTLQGHHIIAARITAENPDEGFKPTSGSIERIKFQPTPSVWGYFSVGANGGIHEYADSQFGHLFARGPTREDARKNLVLALKEVEVRGEIRTTVEYLVQLLETDAFKENTIDTAWLDGILREQSVKVSEQLDTEDIIVGAVVARAQARILDDENAFLTSLGKGQVSLQPLLGMSTFPIELTYEDVKYTFEVTRTSATSMRLKSNGATIDVSLRAQPDNSLLVSFGGRQRRLIATEEPLGLRMSLDGTTVLLPTVYDPSELRTDVTGKVVRYLFDEGDEVKAGQAFVEVEAMKMIMPLKASETGQIAPALSPGSVVSAGDLLATLKLKDPSKAKQILPYDGKFENAGAVDDDDASFEGILERLFNVLGGFDDDYNKLLPMLLSKAPDGTAVLDAVVSMLRRYYDVESAFASAASRDAAVGELIKTNKESLGTVLDYGRAHIGAKKTTQLASALLRSLGTFRTKYGDNPSSEELTAVLTDLSSLSGKGYGEVALEASTFKEEMSAAPFATRVAELRQTLLTSTDRETLATTPSIAAGVDLLDALFTDDDANVREAALEVYFRRVYRAHTMDEINVDSENGEVQWAFHYRSTPVDETPKRYGYMKLVKHIESIDAAAVSAAVSAISARGQSNMVNTVHFVCEEGPIDDSAVKAAEAVVAGASAELRKAGVRFVNVLVPREKGLLPQFFSFTERANFLEDKLMRDMRSSYPHLLELVRIEENFDLKRLDKVGRNTQAYLGTEKADESASKGRRRPQPESVFLRSISSRTDVLTEEGLERLLQQKLDQLERALVNPSVGQSVSSRIYAHVIPDFVDITPEAAVETFKKHMSTLLSRYASQLINLKVDEIELKIRIATGEGDRVQLLRLTASSMTGEWLKLDAFLEYPDPISGVTKKFCTLATETEGSLCLMEPYPVSNRVQVKRAVARRIGTTYAYDFLGLFEKGLVRDWAEYQQALSLGGVSAPDTPENVFQASELVLEGGELKQSSRVVGTNDIGMLAWNCVFKTPQYPEGREMVLIANDVTFQSGSFGVNEDEFFAAASTYAREKGIPRVYISSNSGARIGLVEELKPLIQVAWKDAENPSQGFDYLYLKPEDYASLPEGSVNVHEETAANGEKHMAIDAIVGTVHGIGVENLRGSGMIAGETSRAYSETFTLSYVSGRSVGIGAYLMRLGQRNIQMRNGPMLLTGYSALNKLLANEVYTSQDQLGGPEIMYPNGVSHQLADDDEDGVNKILRWLSYVPRDMKSLPSRTQVADSPEREIVFTPSKTPYDPRDMLAGATSPDGTFKPGFFDAGSFTESLGGWGKSVVTGRGTLGGIPMGVVAVETRAMEQRVPADPADPESREAVRMQAGQVWYPDSAHKTAQAIRDFKGERLPVMIFANWRGFSGGTRDMYNEVLKFGAMIVDALRDHDMPIFVYIPPNGELRGGAWVVVDPTINPRRMEMYADAESRGGILEPPGIVEVKFRAADQKAVMHRLDARLKEMDAEATSTDLGSDEVEREIKERENSLLPVYGQVAVEFADLHDRAGRMVAKGVIRDAVDWPSARSYFYWRLRRRLAEDNLLDSVAKAAPTNGENDVVEQLRLRLDELRSAAGVAADDKSVAEWLDGDGAAAAASAAQEVTTKAVQNKIKALQESLAKL
jgi:acetyl-CoA carboxylase/biotin carboxylase 1